jgi:shikimate kinase
MTETIVITGPVGVGKTTIAFALADRLEAAGRSHAVIDMDNLRHCAPYPPDDPFHIALGLRNLAAIWPNYRALGTEYLIVADVIESRSQRADYQLALPDTALQVVRLQASLPTLHQRLAGREVGDSLNWHQQRAAELIAIMDEHRVEDLLIDTDGRSSDEIVAELLSRCAWHSENDLE